MSYRQCIGRGSGTRVKRLDSRPQYSPLRTWWHHRLCLLIQTGDSYQWWRHSSQWRFWKSTGVRINTPYLYRQRTLLLGILGFVLSGSPFRTNSTVHMLLLHPEHFWKTPSNVWLNRVRHYVELFIWKTLKERREGIENDKTERPKEKNEKWSWKLHIYKPK